MCRQHCYHSSWRTQICISWKISFFSKKLIPSDLQDPFVYWLFSLPFYIASLFLCTLKHGLECAYGKLLWCGNFFIHWTFSFFYNFSLWCKYIDDKTIFRQCIVYHSGRQNNILPPLGCSCTNSQDLKLCYMAKGLYSYVWWSSLTIPSTCRQVKGHPWLHRKFEASLGSMRPCLKMTAKMCHVC